MPEALTTELVVEHLKKLRIAFPSHTGLKTPDSVVATAELYCESLRGLSGEAFRHAVRRSIDEGKFFPKISELREFAGEWTRRHRVELEPGLGDLLWCPRCSTRSAWQFRYRPLVDGDGYLVLSDDRAYLLLDVTQRLLCECAPKSLYRPEPEIEFTRNDPRPSAIATFGRPMTFMAMRLDRIQWRAGRPGHRRPPVLWKPVTANELEASPAPVGMTPIGDLVEGVFEEAAVHA